MAAAPVAHHPLRLLPPLAPRLCPPVVLLSGKRCVAVGVPAKVLGKGKRRTPALAMDQDCFKEVWHGLDI